MEVQFIFVALVANSVLRFARPSVIEVIRATGDINDGSGFRENFHNLFDSVMKNNMRKTNTYRNILELEAVREQQAFHTMKEELSFGRRQRNANKHGDVGESMIAFKREIHENGSVTSQSSEGTRESCSELPESPDAPSSTEQSIYASFTSLEDKYIEHFGNDPRNHRHWRMAKELYLEDGEPTLRKFCAQVHKLAGKGSYQVDSVFIDSRLLHFKNSNYAERYVDILQYTIEQPTSTTSAFHRLVDEKSSDGPWVMVEGLQPDCVYLVNTNNRNITSELFLEEHVCGISI